MNNKKSYTERLEEEVEKLREENSILQELNEKYFSKYQIAQDNQRPSFIKRLFCRKQKYITFYTKNRYFSYGVSYKEKKVSFDTLNDTINRGDTHDIRYISLQSYYNGFHYPVYDCDSKLDLDKCLVYIDRMCAAIPHSSTALQVIESSPNHYWVITNMGANAKYPSGILDVDFCDPQYAKMSLIKRKFFLRASNKPNIPIRILFDKNMECASDNFKEYIEKLVRYYYSPYPQSFLDRCEELYHVG